ncbi:hypothetical protein ACFQ61_02080 [Streptomyces sp. NPDC056500]|uniref:hypothetical protein n=1 Tax=Streptomyces sp. NPDC056500 TaxID=3345840 RepID=UPI0036C3F75E
MSKPRDLLPAATVLADWITDAREPADRIRRTDTYRRASLSPHALAALLAEVNAHAAAGRPEVTADDIEFLVSDRPRRWEDRMVLTSTVTQLLSERGTFDRAGMSAAESAELNALVESLMSRPLAP